MTLKTRPVRLSLLSLLSAPLAGAKINAQLSQSTSDGVVLPSYEIDGTDVVPLVVPLTEDPAKPGDYVGALWPNTRGLKGTRWLINVAAGELLMKSLNLTVIDASSAVEVPLKVMVDAPPYAQVIPSSQVVSVAQGYADAAGHFASLAAASAAAANALGLDLEDIAAAAGYGQTAAFAANIAMAANMGAEVAKSGAVAAAEAVGSYTTLALANTALASIAADKGIYVTADGAGNGFYVKRADVLVRESVATVPSLAAAVDALMTSAPLVGLWADISLDVSGNFAHGVQQDGSKWEARSGVLVQVGQPTVCGDSVDSEGNTVIKNLVVADNVKLPSGIATLGPLVGLWADIELDSAGNFVRGEKYDGSKWIAQNGILTYQHVSRLPVSPEFARSLVSNYAPANNSTQHASYAYAYAIPGGFDQVRVGLVHSGGYGAQVGVSIAVAATDDLGDRSNTNTVNGRKFVSPWRAGVEYNTYSDLGWRRCTFDGAVNVTIPDAGLDSTGTANNLIALKMSDKVSLSGVKDPAHPGWYPLLIRVWPGDGAYTQPGLVGFVDTTKYQAQAGDAYVLGCYRVQASAIDAVANLTAWSASGNNVQFNDAAVLPLVIEAWAGGKRAKSILMIGDSRFAVAGDQQYTHRSLCWFTENRVLALGKKAVVNRCCQGNRTTATYFARANTFLDVGVRPDIAVLLAYSINDGNPTDSLVNEAKARVLNFVGRCAELGIIPIIVSLFPSNNAGTGTIMPVMRAFDQWCESLGFPYISPLRLYGDKTTGTWLAGWNYDAAHMTDGGYADLGQKIGDLAACYI